MPQIGILRHGRGRTRVSEPPLYRQFRMDGGFQVSLIPPSMRMLLSPKQSSSYVDYRIPSVDGVTLRDNLGMSIPYKSFDAYLSIRKLISLNILGHC